MRMKDIIPTKFLWVDLEMTGLTPELDVILEVAAEITDENLQTIASYESRIFQDKQTVLKRMQANPWWKEYPENRDDFVAGLGSAPSLEKAEGELAAFIKKHFADEPAILAGNSIHNDRLFIKQWLPAVDILLHYRMLDVSSLKVIMQSRYNVIFKKPEVHRAYEDIQASIAELEYYLDWFEGKPQQ